MDLTFNTSMQSDLSPNSIALIGARTVARAPIVLPIEVGQLSRAEVPRERHRATRQLEKRVARSAARAAAWWRRYRKQMGLWALLASPVLAGIVGQQYLQHRLQRGAPPQVRSAPIAKASPVTAASPPAVTEAVAITEASRFATGAVPAVTQAAPLAVDGDQGGSPLPPSSAAQPKATRTYEPARLPKAVPPAPAQPVALPPPIKHAAEVPLPLPAALPSVAAGRVTEKAATAEEPAGVRVTLKGVPPATVKSKAPAISEAAPSVPSGKAASVATDAARPQVQPTTAPIQ